LSASTRTGNGWLYSAFCVALLLATPVRAADAPVNADVAFDKTGDGMVDVEDWGRMTKAERQAYARASLEELGLAPDATVGGGRTRLQDYVDGLRSVYGR